MSPLIITLIAVAAFVISMLFTRRFCNPDSAFYILDYPNDRSMHDRPMPLGGGLAILIAIGICGVAVALYYPAHGLTGIAFSILLVAVVSFIDDRHTVSPVYRFVAHAVASAVILYSGFILQRLEIPGVYWDMPHVIGAVLSVLFIVWMINLYNFMDGMDGFAGGMAVFGFGAFAAMGWVVGNSTFLVINLIVAFASAGFLIFNFPPARIFMGDIGSSTLGLLAATLSLWGARDRVFPFWIAVLVFSPFIMDATATLCRRFIQGEKIWQAHKTHYYQQLVLAGWGHRKTVLWEYVLMVACAGSAIWVVRQSGTVQWWTIGFWGMVYALLLIAMTRWLETRDLRAGEDRRT